MKNNKLILSLMFLLALTLSLWTNVKADNLWLWDLWWLVDNWSTTNSNWSWSNTTTTNTGTNSKTTTNSNTDNWLWDLWITDNNSNTTQTNTAANNTTEWQTLSYPADINIVNIKTQMSSDWKNNILWLIITWSLDTLVKQWENAKVIVKLVPWKYDVTDSTIWLQQIDWKININNATMNILNSWKETSEVKFKWQKWTITVDKVKWLNLLKYNLIWQLNWPVWDTYSIMLEFSWENASMVEDLVKKWVLNVEIDKTNWQTEDITPVVLATPVTEQAPATAAAPIQTKVEKVKSKNPWGLESNVMIITAIMLLLFIYFWIVRKQD